MAKNQTLTVKKSNKNVTTARQIGKATVLFTKIIELFEEHKPRFQNIAADDMSKYVGFFGTPIYETIYARQQFAIRLLKKYNDMTAPQVMSYMAKIQDHEDFIKKYLNFK